MTGERRSTRVSKEPWACCERRLSERTTPNDTNDGTDDDNDDDNDTYKGKIIITDTKKNTARHFKRENEREQEKAVE